LAADIKIATISSIALKKCLLMFTLPLLEVMRSPGNEQHD
jgi:hypothetical protein